MNVREKLEKIVTNIGLDPKTSTICFLRNTTLTSLHTEIIATANFFIRPGKIILFIYKKMLPLLIELYNFRTIVEIINVNDLSKDVRLIFSGIYYYIKSIMFTLPICAEVAYANEVTQIVQRPEKHRLIADKISVI